MRYSNMPVYVGQLSGESVSGSQETGRMLFVDSLDVTYDTQLKTQKKLGKCSIGNRNFVSEQNLDCRIKFDFYFNSNIPSGGGVYDFLNFIPNEKNYFPIRIGNVNFKKCFLDDYTITIKPFQPVKGSANFSSYGPPTSGTISGDYTLPDASYNDIMNSNQLVYGHTCELSGVWGDVVPSNVISSIEYKKRVTKDPSFELGEEEPSDFRVEEIEEEVTVESTGLARFIPKEGVQTTGALAVFLKNVSGQAVPNYEINLPAGSTLYTENFNIKGGDTLLTKASVKNLIV